MTKRGWPPPGVAGDGLRSDFSSSSLVRLLGDWAPVQADGMDFAERLGLWLGAFDAMRLQAALQPQRPGHGAAPAPAERQALAEQLQRVRAALAHAIAQDPEALAGADPAEAALAPFQRRHADLQRHMAQMIAPLREQARALLARGGPAGAELASLDAALQAVLAAREPQHLAGVPTLLARRHQALKPAGEAGMSTFREDWRRALLAELDLRLEPIHGLLEALNHETGVSA